MSFFFSWHFKSSNLWKSLAMRLIKSEENCGIFASAVGREFMNDSYRYCQLESDLEWGKRSSGKTNYGIIIQGMFCCRVRNNMTSIVSLWVTPSREKTGFCNWDSHSFFVCANAHLWLRINTFAHVGGGNDRDDMKS